MNSFIIEAVGEYGMKLRGCFPIREKDEILGICDSIGFEIVDIEPIDVMPDFFLVSDYSLIASHLEIIDEFTTLFDKPQYQACQHYNLYTPDWRHELCIKDYSRRQPRRVYVAIQ